MTAPISFNGLSSGIDTEAIIQKLLEIQKTPITDLQNKNQLLGIKRQAFQDVNTQDLALQNQALNLRLDSTFISRTASSSDQNSVTATASLGAAKTNHQVKVLQLAQEASVSSSRYLSQAALLGSNTVGINQVGSSTNLNAPGAGWLRGGVTLTEATTLGDLGLSSDFTLKVDPDAGGTRNPIQITGLSASTTVGQMMQAVRDQVGASVKVQLVQDPALGGKVIQVASVYAGVNISLSGAAAENALGIQNNATVFSNSTSGLGAARATAAIAPEDIPAGTALVVSTNGRAGSYTGTVDLAAAAAGGDILSLSLDSLGVTDFTTLQIDPDASGATGNVAVRNEDSSQLSAASTVGDLITAINDSVPDVTAQIVDGANGARYLQIISNEGGRDITVSQIGASNGILKKIFGDNNDTFTSSDATTDSNDFTMISNFYGRSSNTPDTRKVLSGVKNDYRVYGVADLVQGVTLMGSSAGDVFTPGAARIQINSSASLSVQNSERTQFYGVQGVTNSSFATSFGIDPDGSGDIGLNRSIKDLNAAGAFGLDSAITAGSFKVGDTNLTLTQDEIDSGITLGQLMARINSSGQGMLLQYEASTDRFIATASDYGVAGAITFGGYSGTAGQSNILKVLGLTNNSTATSTSGGVAAGRIDTTAELARAGFSITPTSGTVTINGIAIEIDAQADTIDDVIDKINNSAAGVTASLDPNSNRILLVQKVTKDTSANYIQLGSSSDTSNLFTAFRLIAGANSDGSISNVESSRSKNNVGQARQEAKVEVDNTLYTRKSNTIDDITAGLTYNLLGVSTGAATLTVAGDKDKAIEAITNFIVEYNKLIKLLNPAPIAEADKKNLAPVSDTERSTLTYNELLDRLDKFTNLNKQEFIRKESTFHIMENQIHASLFNPVSIPGSSIQSLADIGINSGTVGSPLASDFTAILVADSIDHDTIKAALQNNDVLNQALETDDVSVAKLFNQNAYSSASVKSTSAFDPSTPLANDITFEVFDGTNRATVTIPAGQQSKDTALSYISSALTRFGLSDITASFDGTGHLQFKTEKTTGFAFIRVLDQTPQGSTDRLNNRFGMSGGSFIGPDASEKAGAAQKTYDSLRGYTGVSGFIPQQISAGGTYGQGAIYDEMVTNQDQITALTDRLNQRETTLRAQFTAMETALSKLQSQQSALSQFTGTTASVPQAKASTGG